MASCILSSSKCFQYLKKLALAEAENALRSRRFFGMYNADLILILLGKVEKELVVVQKKIVESTKKLSVSICESEYEFNKNLYLCKEQYLLMCRFVSAYYLRRKLRG